MGNRSNLGFGIVEVYFDKGDGAGEHYLGYLKGGTDLNLARKFEDLTADDYGDTPLDIVKVGDDLKITAMLAEPTKENISYAVPEGSYVEGAGGDSKFGAGRKAGYLMSNEEGVLRLHPVKNNPDNYNDDVYVHRAVAIDDLDLGFKNEQRLVKVTWRAMIDETQPEGQKLFRIGDPTIS